jgi:hypothetical protein
MTGEAVLTPISPDDPDAEPRPVIARRVAGDAMFNLMGDLGLIAAHDEVKMPLNAEGAVDPMVNVVRRGELERNAPLLEPLDLTSDGFFDDLTGRLPSLAEPIDQARVTSAHWHRNPYKGKMYITLGFAAASRHDLMAEQNDILYELPEMAGKADEQHLFDWKAFDPGIMVLALESSVPASVSPLVRNHIKRLLPFDVSLMPVGRPREYAETA